jgi:adenosylhomocysteine nucleosidase
MIAPTLLVVGLQREARLLAAPNVIAVPGGGDRQGLMAKLSELSAHQPLRAVVSVGLGGGLAPKLDVGEWVVANRIVGEDRIWPTNGGLTKALSHALPSARIGAITAGDAMVTDEAAKSALHLRTAALAVDMESHLAACFAAECGLPFAALRVISDGAGRALPRAAQAGMRKDGGMDILAVLRELAKDPRQLPALIRTGREAEIAFKKLKLLGRDNLLGRLGIGDPDLG